MEKLSRFTKATIVGLPLVAAFAFEILAIVNQQADVQAIGSAAPTIATITPNSSDVSGGVTVAVTGSGFVTEIASMNFDGNSWTDTGVIPTNNLIAQTAFLPTNTSMSSFAYLFGAAPKSTNANGFPFAYEFKVSVGSGVSLEYQLNAAGSLNATGTTGTYTTGIIGAELGYRPTDTTTSNYSMQANWIDNSTSTPLLHHNVTGQSITNPTEAAVPQPLYFGATNNNGTANGGGTNFVGNIYGRFTLSANNPSGVPGVYSSTNPITPGAAVADFVPGWWTVNDVATYGYYERVEGALIVDLTTRDANPTPFFFNQGTGTITPSATIPATTITVANQPCIHVTVWSDTLLTCDIQGHPAGTFDVTVNVNGQSATLSDGFTYTGGTTPPATQPNNQDTSIIPGTPNTGWLGDGTLAVISALSASTALCAICLVSHKLITRRKG